MGRRPIMSDGPETHRCVLPKGEQYSSPKNDRACAHRPGDKVVCDHPGCKHSFGRACKLCDKVV